MKKLWIAVLGVLILSSYAYAEDGKRFNIKVGFSGSGFGLGPQLEVKIVENLSASLLYESISLDAGDIKAESQGFGLGVRYYFNRALAQGPYANMAYFSGSAEGSGDTVVNSGFSVSVIRSSIEADATSFMAKLGYTWMWDNFNTDFSAGYGSISFENIKVSGDSVASDLEDVAGFTLGFTVGYAF